ncbi:hypothetical protein F4V57_13555 [Acinetobacter qingfengensis]|uniref:Lipoprotein n=1 Tax=Acinetobacter qingfengensis TaxID=1262585 RepID=A0A1E7QWR2_9GAMM|nr:hypothetical protein [Acinetobacter qingfengensis]KAA8731323.1 hypothetical protein F4V57_13555 [Acinetobacter qingfengensis]OEY91431.1 hypothetical protein BJI46_06750 [Acinetobacter qingfengensis]
MKKPIITGAIAMLLLTGCATGNVKPSYVSPTKYQSWNCAQLHTEYARIGQYLHNGVEPAKRTGVGVGLGIGGGFGRGGWGIGPTVSVNVGQSSNSKRTEIAELLGQQDAIEQAAQFKNCPIAHPRQKTTS